MKLLPDARFTKLFTTGQVIFCMKWPSLKFCTAVAVVFCVKNSLLEDDICAESGTQFELSILGMISVQSNDCCYMWMAMGKWWDRDFLFDIFEKIRINEWRVNEPLFYLQSSMSTLLLIYEDVIAFLELVT